MTLKFRTTHVLVVAGLAATALTGCLDKGGNQQQAAATPQAVQVVVQQVELSDAIIRTDAPGRATAYQTAEVRPQVSGILQKRLFEEGAMVKEGQSLYRIDPALYKAQVASAKASLLQARANLASTKADAKRSAELVKVNAVSRSADDQAQAAYKVAIANVEAAKAALATAQINLDYTEVRSPITGRVSLSEVTPGALVTANQTSRLTVVQQLDPIYVDVTQSFDELSRLREQAAKGMLKVNKDGSADVQLILDGDKTVQLILDGDKTYKHLGRLTFKDALVDESTGTVRVRAVFDNPDGDLLPGMFVRARLVDGVRENVIKIDQRATMRRTTGDPYVYVVNAENKVESRDVVIGGTEGTNWIINKGLKDGDKVIVEGLQRVRPGALVQYTVAGEKPAAAPTQATK